MCDQLTNSCGADATAKATCAQAQAAADTATPKTGAQADKFNAVFGITTNFAAVAEVDDQGNVVAGTGDASSAASSAVSSSASSAVSSSASSAAPAAASSSAASGIGNFGSCSVPKIIFGTGFDGRKETAFEPADQGEKILDFYDTLFRRFFFSESYNHGSADNIDIITQFMCDQLTNSCGADATAKATCAQAQAAADTATPKTGAQADKFNAVFGITTNFAAVAEVDDQGNVVAGTGDASSAASSASASSSASSAAPAATSSSVAVSAAASGIGNFGSCSVPQINFGTGFDNRKETAFEPADQSEDICNTLFILIFSCSESYAHGSADNIGVISNFICLALTNTCGADQTAKDTCTAAQAAANAATPLTGAQADAFNAAFGIKTNFASVPVVDNTGKVVSSTSSA